MSITLKFDRDLTTRSVYLCKYEPQEPSSGLTSLWNLFSNANEDRWVNQGDSVFIRSVDMVLSDDDSNESLLSRLVTLILLIIILEVPHF